MKIAFVRGPFLNPWELQTYIPLSRNHLFKPIGADWEAFSNPLRYYQGPAAMVHVWGAWGQVLGRSVPVTINRGRSWTLGESFGLAGLEKATRECDILHSAETHSTITWQCLQIRQRRPCKVVATIWENIPHMGETHPRRKARKHYALNHLDGFLAVTETTRRMLLAEGAPEDRIDVIPMAVDLRHFSPAPKEANLRAEWDLDSNEKVVLFIGRWVDEKGIQDILKAIPEVLRTSPVPVRFSFVGDGPLRKALEKASRQWRGRITLVPFASYERLPAIHNMADIFILPSKPLPKWEEQFGYVLIESMACGKSVITTRSGSIPDVVGDAAVLIPPGDPTGLAASLIRLLASDSERLRLGTLARRRVETSFDAQLVSRRIESFYERVLKQPS